MEIIIQVIAFYINFSIKRDKYKAPQSKSCYFLLSFSLIITTFATSEPPQNSTKNKCGTRGYTQRLSIKELNIPRMFG